MTAESAIPPMPTQGGQSSHQRQAAREEYQEFLNWRRNEGGERGQFVEPDISTSGQALRAGLRRHIYGCLKRSENCWLEIHRLFCETPEIDDDFSIANNMQSDAYHISEQAAWHETFI